MKNKKKNLKSLLYFSLRKYNFLLCLVCLAISTGCSANTYKIVNAKSYFKSKDYPDTEYDTTTTILLNTETGETWALNPSDDSDGSGEEWIKIRIK